MVVHYAAFAPALSPLNLGPLQPRTPFDTNPSELREHILRDATLREYALREGGPAQPSLEQSSWPQDYVALNWHDVWKRTLSAELRYRSALWSEGRCVVVFRRGQPGQRHLALTARERAILTRTLHGDRQKLIAAEARIATSTVANCLKAAILKLGFKNRLEAAPLAALVVSRERGSVDSTGPVLSIGPGELVVAAAPEPRWSRLPTITASERAICIAIIQGGSNSEIAAQRNSSVHTVENQVASVFRKLGASGRFDLLRLLYSS